MVGLVMFFARKRTIHSGPAAPRGSAEVRGQHGSNNWLFAYGCCDPYVYLYVQSPRIRFRVRLISCSNRLHQDVDNNNAGHLACQHAYPENVAAYW